MKKNWKIYIVAHNRIIDEYYSIDSDFNNKNWGFINVSDDKLRNSKWYDKYDIINMTELPGFKKLGAWYTESEAIYNVYINDLYKKYDYVGFIHYDYQLMTVDNKVNITEQIEDALSKYDLIYFSKCWRDYWQRILADETKPNLLTGQGLNCYDYIINDYNNFYGKKESIEEWKGNIPKNICSASLYSKNIFEKMMKFLSPIIECGKLNIFDTKHRYRIQGGLMERYISVFLDKLKIPYYDLELKHNYKDK
jgi:hypothetical protein